MFQRITDDALNGSLPRYKKPNSRTCKSSDQLHIVHVTESVRGGTSTYLEQLIKDNLRHGYRVTLVSDIVHLHGTFPGLYVRIFGSLPYKVLHCAHGWAFCQDVPWVKKLFYAGIEHLLSRKTDATINISHFEGCAAARWRLGGEQVVIRNGVIPSRATGRHVIEPSADMLNLGFIGRFDRQKGLEILLDAVSKCQSPAVHLWVAGTHSRDPQARHGTGGNVSFIGWLNSDRVDDFICDLDAVVIPSRWEGFGLVGIEAMRNAKPLIVSDRGALSEMLIHGFNGVLFSLDDPAGLIHALENCDREKLRKMGANALLVYRETFGVEFMLGQINALYQDLVSVGEEARQR
jgi:glycosyltransferase involved in cell wall biosynthesis